MIKRLDYIDVLKGLGILFVVIGHLYTIKYCRAYVYSFHLPLFFIVSGLLLNVEKYTSFKDFFKSRFKQLFFPFMVLYSLLWLYWLFVERPYRSIDVTPLDTAFGLIWASDSWKWIFPAGILWFIPALCSLELLYYSVVKIDIKKGFHYLILTVLFLFGLWMAHEKLFILPWGLNNALIVIPFFAVGHALRRKILFENIIGELKKTYIIIAIATFFLSSLLFSEILVILGGKIMNISRLVTGPLWYYLTLPFIGTASWLLLSKAIGSNKLLQWFGRNTLPILAFHSPVGRAVITVVGYITKSDKITVEETWYYAIITILLTLLICWPLCVIWNKWFPKVRDLIVK